MFACAVAAPMYRHMRSSERRRAQAHGAGQRRVLSNIRRFVNIEHVRIAHFVERAIHVRGAAIGMARRDGGVSRGACPLSLGARWILGLQSAMEGWWPGGERPARLLAPASWPCDAHERPPISLDPPLGASASAAFSALVVCTSHALARPWHGDGGSSKLFGVLETRVLALGC